MTFCRDRFRGNISQNRMDMQVKKPNVRFMINQRKIKMGRGWKGGERGIKTSTLVPSPCLSSIERQKNWAEVGREEEECKPQPLFPN